jgi:AcrR family transcriptional regulator
VIWPSRFFRTVVPILWYSRTVLERSHTPKGQRARERILVAAERLIAAHGFHGTSMRDVAAAARLPLATTIYHFARKEQLYAAVLAEIASDLDRAIDAALSNPVRAPAYVEPGRRQIDVAQALGVGEPLRPARDSLGRASGSAAARDPLGRAGEARDARDPLDAFALALVRWMRANPARVRLLTRELLDNPTRVARAGKLPLAPFLERATGLVALHAVTSGRSHATLERTPEVAVLHAVGALSYFVAAWPTVERILGPARAKRVDAAYEREALAFVRGVLGITPEATREPDAAMPAGRARARSPRA